MNHQVAPTIAWICPIDGNRREVPVKHVGQGAPACPVCRAQMIREEIAPSAPGATPLAQAAERLDPELQQESELDK